MAKNIARFKGAFLADIHMSNKLPYAKPTSRDRTDRLDQQLEVLHRIHEKAAAEGCQALFLLGDLFDKSLVDAVTLTHTVQEIAEWTLPTYILPGNHDANNIRGGRFTVEAFGVMGRKHLSVLGEKGEALEPNEWLAIWSVSYKPVGETREEIKAIKGLMSRERTNVLLFHNSVLGAQHAGWTCDEGLLAEEVCGDGFDWTLAGHFHDTQVFGEKGTGLYLGAPMHHHFGDTGRKAGFWIIEFTSDGKRAAEFVPGGAPHFYVVKALDAKVKAKAGDYLRFDLEATHADWATEKLKAREAVEALKARGINASFRHKPIYHHKTRMASGSKAATLTLDEAVSKYVDMAGVIAGGLEAERLKALGRDALAAARSAYGID
jgi:DNA repair exonuclease SbcCD nuclease subunit